MASFTGDGISALYFVRETIDLALTEMQGQVLYCVTEAVYLPLE